MLEQVLTLAVEIAREVREGKKIGTMFIISDSVDVLEQSWCLILDPLSGHPSDKRRIDDYNMRETVKELAQLDGAFIVSNDVERSLAKPSRSFQRNKVSVLFLSLTGTPG